MKTIATTVRHLRRLASVQALVVGKQCMAVLVCMLVAGTALAQKPNVHFLHAGALPPGAIGSQRLLRGGPLLGYIQPAEIRVPAGATVSMAIDGQFSQAAEGNPVVGLLVGSVYRFKVSNLRDDPSLELFPTVELIDRLYPPPGKAVKFPVPIELTEQELNMAARGMFVTRVIYVENPQEAFPEPEKNGQRWFEAREDEDPLAVADQLGRPIAILRVGGRHPGANVHSPRFTYGCPPVVQYGLKVSKEQK